MIVPHVHYLIGVGEMLLSSAGRMAVEIKERKDSVIEPIDTNLGIISQKTSEKHPKLTQEVIDDINELSREIEEDALSHKAAYYSSEVDKIFNSVKMIMNKEGEFMPNPSTIAMEDDAVNSPSHYTRGSIETIDYIEDKDLSYNLGNAVKYVSRAGHKNPNKTAEDLKKAVWYINREIAKIDGTD